MVSKTLTVTNPSGLHLRPAGVLFSNQRVSTTIYAYVNTLKIPPCFDVWEYPYKDSPSYKTLDLGNVQYIMIDSCVESLHKIEAKYIKANKLKFTQMIDEKGNLKEFGYPTEKSTKKGKLATFDLLNLVEGSNVYLPSLQYCNELTLYKEYADVDNVKKGDFGYEVIKKYKRSVIARNRALKRYGKDIEIKAGKNRYYEHVTMWREKLVI